MDLKSNKTFRHPMDLVETVASYHNWPFERLAEDELLIHMDGVFANYEIFFSWISDYEGLHVTSTFSLTVSKNRQNELDSLLLHINSKMLMGHFDYWAHSQKLAHRQMLLLTNDVFPTRAQVEMLLLYALDACESHHHTFELVSSSKTSTQQAVRYALFETAGTA